MTPRGQQHQCRVLRPGQWAIELYRNFRHPISHHLVQFWHFYWRVSRIAIPYSRKFSYGANFRIFRMCLLCSLHPRLFAHCSQGLHLVGNRSTKVTALQRQVLPFFGTSSACRGQSVNRVNISWSNSWLQFQRFQSPPKFIYLSCDVLTHSLWQLRDSLHGWHAAPLSTGWVSKKCMDKPAAHVGTPCQPPHLYWFDARSHWWLGLDLDFELALPWRAEVKLE